MKPFPRQHRSLYVVKSLLRLWERATSAVLCRNAVDNDFSGTYYLAMHELAALRDPTEEGKRDCIRDNYAFCSYLETNNRHGSLE